MRLKGVAIATPLFFLPEISKKMLYIVKEAFLGGV